MSTAAARANTNIALVKYWGKRDPVLNLPATSSLSMTLSSMGTTTRVTFDDSLALDEMLLGGQPASDAALARTRRFLDLVRRASGTTRFARVETANDFPTASGLASSASGFAALALAATRAAGMDADLATVADLARRGSGSAPRSLLGGFVELLAGERPDGADCVVRQVATPDHWDVRMVVVMNGRAEKAVGSTDGMDHTRRTSPYYPAWLAGHDDDMQAARRAIADRDLDALGRVAEASCFRMHAVALGSSPPLLYWSGATVDVVRKVWELRAAGLAGYATIDAGPHVKVLCSAADAAPMARELGTVPGVDSVVIERPGPGAEVMS